MTKKISDELVRSIKKGDVYKLSLSKSYRILSVMIKYHEDVDKYAKNQQARQIGQE